jgi:hypothetical protein
MKTKSNSQSTFFNPRVLIGFALYAAGLVLAFAPMSSMAAEDNAAAELSQSVPAQAPGAWKVTGDLVPARYGHTATLLPNGQVLVAGYSGTSAELCDVGLGFSSAWQPKIRRLKLTGGKRLLLTGCRTDRRNFFSHNPPQT